jgi:hypothetical protein
MTDLAVHQPGPLATPGPMPAVTGAAMPGLAVLEEWVTAAQRAESLVSPLVDTPFLPASLWPLPPGVYPKDMPNPRVKHPRESDEDWRYRRQVACSSGTAAVLTGMTLGLDPLVALAQVFVVKGKPGLYTKIKVALAQRAGHDVWDEELTPEAVTVAGRRKGWPESRVVRIRITLEQAKQADWTRNDTYAKTPVDMLWSRAASRVLDRIAADTLNGIPSIETLDDTPEITAQVTAEVVTDPGPARVTAASILAKTGASAPEPATVTGVGAPAAPDGPTQAPVTVAVLPATTAQLDRIRDRFAEIGLGGRAAAARTGRMRVVSHIVDRPIEDPRALTADEAAMVLDNLTGEAARGLVDQILRTPEQAQPATDPAPTTTPADTGRVDQADDYGYDPTLEADWDADEAEAQA